nr:hypothetical ORF-8 protein - Leishmania tarentolae mitochondrion [Leishmania tarentolae]
WYIFVFYNKHNSNIIFLFNLFIILVLNKRIHYFFFRPVFYKSPLPPFPSPLFLTLKVKLLLRTSCNLVFCLPRLPLCPFSLLPKLIPIDLYKL